MSSVRCRVQLIRQWLRRLRAQGASQLFITMSLCWAGGRHALWRIETRRIRRVGSRRIQTGGGIAARMVSLRSELWCAQKDRIIRMSLDMLFQILGSLKCLAAALTCMRLEWNMDTNVRSNVISRYISPSQCKAAHLTYRFTVAILQFPHEQVRLRLLVLFLPICSSQTWL